MSTDTIEILRGELERLFSLDEMTSMSRRLLGLDPEDVGGAGAKATFAKALTERCIDGERVDALVDVILHSRKDVDPRVRDMAALLGGEEHAPGTEIDGFRIQKKIGESQLGIVYLAQLDGKPHTLKILRREASRDRRAVHRFLTANRLVATLDHGGLPKSLTAGELSNGAFFVAYEYVDGQTLAVRLARTGPAHVNELKPFLRALLEPLAALHKAHLIHGDLKLENVLVVNRLGGDTSDPKAVLIDFGTDRLRQRSVAANGHTGLLAVFGSPKTVAPELVRGRAADARADVYAFGAILYELLCGKSVFTYENATDAAIMHLNQEPEAPSSKAPRGWITKEVDTFALLLLQKDPSRRPKDALALLEMLETLGRNSAQLRATKAMPSEKVDELIDALVSAPVDSEAALALEKAVDEGADPAKVAEAFCMAADQVPVEADDGKEAKKGLLYRAARIFESQLKDRERTEKIYAQLIELDPSDEIARVALEEVRRQLGKYDEIVESLVARTEAATPGEERARIFAEIGRLCATELEDPDQALVAYLRALGDTPSNHEYVAEIERLAGDTSARWTEVLDTATEAVKGDSLSAADRTALLAQIGRWYDTKTGRADMALHAFQEILKSEPANEAANEGLSIIYRRAQQWPELAAVLLARADSSASTPRARDLRAEAAEIFDTKLEEPARARDLYGTVLGEDPGHARASDALARIAERSGDFQTLVKIFEKRADARRGAEKADALAKVAEVYEERLNDLGEATRRYEAALALEPAHLESLKALDRIYNRTGRYRELLETLERQVACAATPRQKINLFERMAALHDEEFLDHVKASQALEQILTIDSTNDAALTALARHYRAQDRWEDAAKLYEKHASVTGDDARRVELIAARARTLADQIGSPERATRAYEQVLELAPGHPGALEALAHLRELSGDSHAALSAIEALATKAQTPEAKAEQWMRAARLLEARGDKDGAIERYKLALEANPKDPTASSALRQAHTQRGDFPSVVALIEREISHVEGDLAKARLHAELAKIYRTKLKSGDKAESNARRALDLDATNADALMVLGDLAFLADRFLEATKAYETLVGRTAALPKEDAVRVLVQFVEALGKTSQSILPPPASGSESGPASGRPTLPAINHPRMNAAVEALHHLAPDEPSALERVARVVFEHGDPKAARTMYQDLITVHGDKLSASDRADALYRLGESTRRSGDFEGAIAPLQKAADTDPVSPLPLQALAKIYEERADWEGVLRTKGRRLEVARGTERFDLLLEIGDLEFQKLDDRPRAQKTYATALEERPDDRKLLTKLMQLYSEEKDWAKLIEVVLRLADFVEDPKQRAKYMHTAAIVSSRQLADKDKAIEFYERALEFDPTLTKALEEVLELRKEKGDHEAVEKLLNVQLDQAKTAQDRVKIPKILDELGELYRTSLKEPAAAIDAFEAAQAFDPEDKQRAEALAELYASDVTKYLDKAVKAQAQILRRNPYRVESFKLLRRLYTEGKRGDPAWCLCQALSVMNLAAPDEERFYKRHRADNAAPAQSALSEEDWTKLAHPDLDPLVTKIFALIQPTIVRTRTPSIEQLGYDARYAIDTALHPYPVSQTLHYVQGVLGIRAPLVFQNTNDPGALGFVHAQTPGIVLGRAAFENVSTQSMAFIAGRHLAYFRPGYYVRHVVPTGTGLKAWLFAVIKMSVPQFPVAADMQHQVTEAMTALAEDFQGAQKDMLASLVSKVLQAGGALDLKKWVSAVDHTADRAGFLLAHDLQVTTEVMRATEDAASVPAKERMKEIVLFSVGEEYFAIREKLQIGVDS